MYARNVTKAAPAERVFNERCQPNENMLLLLFSASAGHVLVCLCVCYVHMAVCAIKLGSFGSTAAAATAAPVAKSTLLAAPSQSLFVVLSRQVGGRVCVSVCLRACLSPM